MKIAIYARVSTDKQSTDMQVDELKRYAIGRGWEIKYIYQDQMSGTKENRPQLDYMLQAAARKEFDAILVWKLDRFGRSLKHLLTTLNYLENIGITFISLKDNLDFSTPAGRFQIQILGAVAEFEAAMIRDRVKSGMRRAAAEGKRLGRPVLVDYDIVLGLFNTGLSPGKIARKLNFSRSGIRKILKNLGKI